MVRQRALAGRGLAGVVEDRDLDFRRERLGLGLGELGPARVLEVAIGDEAQRMAGGADLLIDLKAALELVAVEGAEDAFEAEADGLRMLDGRGGQRRRR